MKVYYNRTFCYIEPTNEITCIILDLVGGAIITDTTPQEYSLTHKDHKIIIFAHQRKTAGLEKLFTFKGPITIRSCRVLFVNSRPINVGVQSTVRSNSSENLHIIPEDMTLTTEEYTDYNLKNSRKDTAGKRLKGITLQHKTKDNIMPSMSLWTKDNEPYTDLVHYHLDGRYKGNFLSGATFTSDSVKLFRHPAKKIFKPALDSPTLKRFMRNIKR